MPIELAEDPPFLIRIGRLPDPLAWPPIAYTGHGRYDDLTQSVSTLYAASERRAAFLETLDTFRPNPALLAQLFDRSRAITDENYPGPIAPDFFRKVISRFAVTSGHRWLDVRSPATQEHLRRSLAPEIDKLGFGDRFVLGDLLARNHVLTRVVAQWAIQQGMNGIAYSSCHDPSLTCWALFEGVQLVWLNPPEPVTKTDPDLIAVAKLWNLEIPDQV